MLPKKHQLAQLSPNWTNNNTCTFRRSIEEEEKREGGRGREALSSSTKRKRGNLI